MVALLGLLPASPVIADSLGNARAASQTQDTESRVTPVSAGAKIKAKGVILRRENNGFILRDMTGAEMNVTFNGATKIEEKKSNPFRSAKKYGPSQLVGGLYVEVEGRGDSSGALSAEKIKFSDDNLRVAMTVDSQVVPLERRVGRAEQNAERLSGQLQELSEVANVARGGAKAAQESADAAIEGVNRTNERISDLDNYELRKSVTINFRVGSAVLSPDAKASLDEIAAQAQAERGFVIEVRGFASSDGSLNLNRQLSQRRSDAVVRYLAETHDIPLRRIVLPFGYGEASPIADNMTREGRQQNRRAEVNILVSRGMTSPINVTRPATTSTNNNEQ
jgi:outer membrane protein OmpA-like peptidoglycan-associated protein